MIRTLALATLALGTTSAIDFKTCNTDNLGISSIDVDAVVAGKTTNIDMKGTPSVDVTAGAVTAKVEVMGITIATKNFDMCADMNLACPLVSGSPFEATVAYPIPSSAPAGITATVKLEMHDAAGANLSCVQVEVKTSKSASLRTGKTSQAEIEFLFEAWRREQGIEFDSAQEYVDRLAVFAANHVRILEHNTSGSTFTLAHNQFSHLTAEEFKAQLNGFSPSSERRGTQLPFDLAAVTTTDVDWTTKGAVTPVKNQGQCGSCWAFSTTGSVEGAYYLKTGELLSLSEQELVDCDTGDAGCGGGLMDTAFGYVEKNGLAAETDYTYDGVGETCGSSSHARSLSAGAIVGFTDVPAGSETALLSAVAQQPVSVAIEADQTSFQFYSSGVMTGDCGHNLDHGVLAVGFGTDNGVDYWKVKNSWGASWGEDGYIRMERNVGMCGIADAASYPTA